MYNLIRDVIFGLFVKLTIFETFKNSNPTITPFSMDGLQFKFGHHGTFPVKIFSEGKKQIKRGIHDMKIMID